MGKKELFLLYILILVLLSVMINAQAVVPRLVINTPVNNSNYSSTTVILNITATQTGIQTLGGCHFTLNNAQTNTTARCSTGIENMTNMTLSAGLNTLIVYANHSSNNRINESDPVTVTVDTTVPTATQFTSIGPTSIVVTNPTVVVSGTAITINITVNEPTTLSSTIIAGLQRGPDLRMVSTGLEVTRFNSSLFTVTVGADDTTLFSRGTFLLDLTINDTVNNIKRYDNGYPIFVVYNGNDDLPRGFYVQRDVVFTGNQFSTINGSYETNVSVDVMLSQNVANTSVVITAWGRSHVTNGTGNQALNVSNPTMQPGTSTAIGELGKFFDIIVNETVNTVVTNGTIAVSYAQVDVTSRSLQESTLTIYVYSNASAAWSKTNITWVDTTNNIVYANVTTFSSFGVFGTNSSAENAGSTSSSSAVGAEGGGTPFYEKEKAETVVITTVSPQELALQNLRSNIGLMPAERLAQFVSTYQSLQAASAGFFASVTLDQLFLQAPVPVGPGGGIKVEEVVPSMEGGKAKLDLETEGTTATLTLKVVEKEGVKVPSLDLFFKELKKTGVDVEELNVESEGITGAAVTNLKAINVRELYNTLTDLKIFLLVLLFAVVAELVYGLKKDYIGVGHATNWWKYRKLKK